VSKRLVVFGANTGGLYVFSRKDRKLLQIAFADKVSILTPTDLQGIFLGSYNNLDIDANKIEYSLWVYQRLNVYFKV